MSEKGEPAVPKRILPSLNDPVDICFVTKSNYLWANGITRKLAVQFMRNWLAAREAVSSRNEHLEVGLQHLTHGTYSVHAEVKERDEDGDQEVVPLLAIAVSDIIGIYTRNSGQSLSDRQVELQERLLEMMQREQNSGEEWKTGFSDHEEQDEEESE